MNITEYAAAHGVSRQCVYMKIRAGHLAAKQRQGHWYVDPAEPWTHATPGRKVGGWKNKARIKAKALTFNP